MEEVEKKAILAWKNMHYRCYYPKYKHYHLYGGRGVTVCWEWHKLEPFVEWYCSRYFEGCQVDKDLLQPDSKTYSPETCVLVPSWVNTMLGSNRGKSYTGLPLGVYRVSKNCKFRSQINMGSGKGLKHLGVFSNPEDAHKAYLVAKRDYIDSRREELMTYHPKLYESIIGRF